MAKKESKKKASNKEIAAATSNVFQYLKLINVRLTSVNSQLVIRSGELPNAYEVSMQCSVGASAAGNNVHANCLVDVIGKPDGNREAESAVSIKAEYQCVFRVEDVDADALMKDGDQIAGVGALIAWPYLRELVQTLTGRMGLLPFAMPMITRTENGIEMAAPPLKRD